MKKNSISLLTVNITAQLIALALLGGILTIISIISRTDMAMLFGMLLAFTFPALLVFAFGGFILYVVLLVLNIRATILWLKKKSNAGHPKLTLLTFGGVTVTVALLAAVSGVISAPLFMIGARIFSVSNPLVTRPVRIVPVYPMGRTDDQSQFDEVGQTYFRSYNVSNKHPDEIAIWYQKVFTQPSWMLVQTRRYEENDSYIGELVYHCIIVERNIANQQRFYYIEVFGKDAEANSETHVNIGTPKPITDICGQFLRSP